MRSVKKEAVGVTELVAALVPIPGVFAVLTASLIHLVRRSGSLSIIIALVLSRTAAEGKADCCIMSSWTRHLFVVSRTGRTVYQLFLMKASDRDQKRQNLR